MAKYAFYDFETTGTSPKFDQALQFAAILTDENFKPIEEINIRCRLSDNILPSPIALAVTGMKPEQLLEQELNYYEFSLELANIIERWTPAIWTGYNTISFDENFFRQMFYQNLHSNPYQTQMNGNLRLDILKAVYACWGYQRPFPTIPTLENGKLTSKLDTLAPHNGFNDHIAHDALGDVKATIFIAQLIRDKNPDLWEKIISNLNKEEMKKRLQSGQIFQLIERWGAGAPKIYTGVFCGFNSTNKNQCGYFDLDANSAEDFRDANPKLIADAVEKSPKKIRTLDFNKMPLMFALSNPSEEQQNEATQIQNNHSLHDAVGNALAERYADREKSDQVEDQIYDGFYTYPDKALLNQFHKSSWPDRVKILGKLQDARLKELGTRLLVLYSPEHATNDQKGNFWQNISSKWSGEVFYGENKKDPGNTYASVQEDLEQLMPGGKFEVSPVDLLLYQAFFDERKFPKM